MATQKLHSLLAEAMRAYHIEYHGYMSNHVSQGLIALYRLGAPAERLQEFYDHYVATTLDATKDRALPSEGRISEDNYKESLGKHTYFLDYVEFFTGQIAAHGAGATVTTFLGELHPGCCNSAFHPLIQLGFGADVGNTRVMAEGLAYLCYSYHPVFSPRVAMTSADETPEIPELLEALERLRESPPLKALIARAGFSGMQFQDKMVLVASTAKWDHDAILGDFLPASADLPSHLTEEAAHTVISRLVLLAVLLFERTGARDFFLLHGVTSTRATKKLLPLVHDGGVRANLLRHLWRGLLLAYVCQGMPNVFRPLPRPTEPAVSGTPPERWRRVEDIARRSTEEHIIKMVYSLREEDAEFATHPDEDKQLIPRQLFLRTAEDMAANSGPNGEHFSFNGVGFGGGD